MIVFPKAKINLGLRITEKRPDGYHNIETVFYPVGLSDALEFAVSDDQLNRDTIVVTGINTESDPDDNLVIKAVRKLREKQSFPLLKIHLHKAIPVGAGLGGGSSDAALILKAIDRRFGLSLGNDYLKKTSLTIGSDCPFFIDPIPSFATGRGEVFKPVGHVLSGFYLVLLNPGLGINTREAYQNCNPATPPASLFELIAKPVEEWKGLILNDFEDFAFKKHPVIGEIKKELYDAGAVFSLMSGSGSSVYGLFTQKTKLQSGIKKYIIWEGTM